MDVPTLTAPSLSKFLQGHHGRLLRLRGRGLEADDRRGDQLVEIVVVIPAALRMLSGLCIAGFKN